MFDDFILRALIAGIGIALVAGPIGCFIIWRRLSFFGDTLAHSALLGLILGVSLDINLMLSVFLISLLIGFFLIQLEKLSILPNDALLGLLSHSSLAVGLVILGFFSFINTDITGILFGDLLAVNTIDITVIWIGGTLIILILLKIWKSLLASTISYEIAEAEDMKPLKSKVIFILIVAGVVALSLKIVGLLLITGLLILPAAMARNLAASPIQMIILSTIGGVSSVIFGLIFSIELNSPTGPSIVVAALVLFVLSLIIKQINLVR